MPIADPYANEYANEPLDGGTLTRRSTPTKQSERERERERERRHFLASDSDGVAKDNAPLPVSRLGANEVNEKKKVEEKENRGERRPPSSRRSQ